MPLTRWAFAGTRHADMNLIGDVIRERSRPTRLVRSPDSDKGGAEVTMTTRVFYSDVKPYAVPARLEDLCGPSTVYSSCR